MAAHTDTEPRVHYHNHATFDPMVLSIALLVFALFSYFLCIVLALAYPPMAESMKTLYPALFPGFVWLTAASIAWGAVFLAIAAVYVGCGFALVYNSVCRLLRS